MKQASAINPRIYVRNRQRAIRVDMRVLQQFAERALNLALAAQSHRRSIPGFPHEIWVLLISDRRMSHLHQQFMNAAGPTDVITFQHGEIFISVETARRQGRQFGTSTVREIQLYLVHGILHLQGFDDRSATQRARMRAAETALVGQATRLK